MPPSRAALVAAHGELMLRAGQRARISRLRRELLIQANLDRAHSSPSAENALA